VEFELILRKHAPVQRKVKEKEKGGERRKPCKPEKSFYCNLYVKEEWEK